MKISEQLRAGADYMREHGFSPYIGTNGCARCLIGAVSSGSCDYVYHATDYLVNALNIDVDEDVLAQEGWDTDNAVAALEIAADIAECEGL